MRRTSVSGLVLVLVLVLVAVACGGEGRGGDRGGNIDATASTDAPGTLPIDAPPTSTQMGIGQACTPVQDNPQADCPVGFECLSLTGGGGPWCSKICVRGPMTDMCNVGYVGPGIASCVYDITTPDMVTRPFCGIVCMDTTGLCPAGQCDNTCPTPLACTAELKNGDNVVAKACF